MLLRTHGEMLTARRKNRLERFRLDQQLKELEKDGARQKFQVERQKRSVLLAWQSIPLTTGYSDKAQAPDSLQDNAYHKSKHSQRRLPEKRLMQWKAREKELEKFLWRFESQHGKNTSSKQYLPRSARSESSKVSPAFFKTGQTTAEVLRSLESSLKDFQLLQLGELVRQNDSAASFSGVSVFSNSEAESGVSKDHPVTGTEKISAQSARSVTVSSVPNADVIVRSKNPFEELKAIHDSASSDLDYKAFIRARSKAATKFFVTKDKVVMKNGFLKTYTEIETQKKLSNSDIRKTSRCKKDRSANTHTVMLDTENGDSLDTCNADLTADVDLGNDNSLDTHDGGHTTVRPDSEMPTEMTGKRVGFAKPTHADTSANKETKAKADGKPDSLDGHVSDQTDLSDAVDKTQSFNSGADEIESGKQKKEEFLSTKKDALPTSTKRVDVKTMDSKGNTETEPNLESINIPPNLINKGNNDEQQSADKDKKQLSLSKSHYDRNKTHRKCLKIRQQAAVVHKITKTPNENPSTTNANLHQTNSIVHQTDANLHQIASNNSDSPETELNSQRHDDSKSSETQTSGPNSQKDTISARAKSPQNGAATSW